MKKEAEHKDVEICLLCHKEIHTNKDEWATLTLSHLRHLKNGFVDEKDNYGNNSIMGLDTLNSSGSITKFSWRGR